MRKTTLYFVQIGHKIEGPYSLHEVLELPLTYETLIWKEGMLSWAKVSEFDEFSEVFVKMPPPMLAEITKEKTDIDEDKKDVSEIKSQKYFVYKDDLTKGPYSFDEVLYLGITKDTLIWKDGMSSWQKASEFSEFQPYIYVAPAASSTVSDNDTKNKIVATKRSGSWEWLLTSLLCLILIIFFLLFFRCCTTHFCPLYQRHHCDTTCHSKPIPVPTNQCQPTIADTNGHAQYILEIEQKILACYMTDQNLFSWYQNIQNSNQNKYLIYINNLAADVKQKYSQYLHTNHHRHIKADYDRYSDYIDNITLVANAYFKQKIDTLSDTNNLYDKTYLACIDELLIKIMQHAKHHCPCQYTYPQSKPLPTHAVCPDVVYQYPNIFLGHNVYDISFAYGKNYVRNDVLYKGAYNIIYENPDYQTTYSIDRQTNKCFKFIIKFYKTCYYNSYLRQMFSSSIAINYNNNTWISGYENKPIEIDLQPVDNNCTPTLIYYYTCNSASATATY